MTKERYNQYAGEYSRLIKTMRFHSFEKMVTGLVEFCKLIPHNAQGIEVGSFAGESTAIMLESIPGLRIICVDPWIDDYMGRNKSRQQKRCLIRL